MLNNNDAIKATLMQLYNTDKHDPLLVTDYDFVNPVQYSGLFSTKNTKLYMVPKPNSGKYGRITLYYNRIDLSNFEGFTVTRGVKTSTLDVCDELNDHYGINLYPDDLLPDLITGAPTLFITASPSSLMFIGGCHLTLT